MEIITGSGNDTVIRPVVVNGTVFRSNDTIITGAGNIKQLATEALQKSEPSAWFEVLYAQAQGDTTQIPWAKLAPHPYLQDWLANHKPLVSGQKALVIGCGLYRFFMKLR